MLHGQIGLIRYNFAVAISCNAFYGSDFTKLWNTMLRGRSLCEIRDVCARFLTPQIFFEFCIYSLRGQCKKLCSQGVFEIDRENRIHKSLLTDPVGPVVISYRAIFIIYKLFPRKRKISEKLQRVNQSAGY